MKRMKFLFLSMLISVLFIEIQARKLQQICSSSSSCGEIQNISYPYRLTTDPLGCGDPDYELSCKNNQTIMEFRSNEYLVKKISYETRKIPLADVSFINGSCGVPSKSLTYLDTYEDGRYRGIAGNSYTSFVKCERNVSDAGYIRLPCLSTNSSQFYALYGSSVVTDMKESCMIVVTVLIKYSREKNPSYETFRSLMESGFDLGWTVECKDCLASGDECSLTSFGTPYIYECYKDDFISRFITATFALSWVFLFALHLIARFIIAPIGLVFICIHTYRKHKKLNRGGGDTEISQ